MAAALFHHHMQYLMRACAVEHNAMLMCTVPVGLSHGKISKSVQMLLGAWWGSGRRVWFDVCVCVRVRVCVCVCVCVCVYMYVSVHLLYESLCGYVLTLSMSVCHASY